MLRNFLKATPVVLAMGLALSAQADDGISVANGKVKFNSNAQFWTVNDVKAVTKTNMFVRRAELKFSGALNDSTRWTIMVDPAATQQPNSTSTAFLQDVAITHSLFVPEFEMTVGQMKIITAAESLDPSAELMFPERSMLARTVGERREPSAMFAYKADMWKMAGMISNGNGSRASDAIQTGETVSQSNRKDLHFRFDVKPMEMVSGGLFTSLKNFNYGQNAVWGGNIRLMPIEDLVLRFEAARARTANISQNGWNVDAGYQYGDWQPVARFESQQNNGVTGTATTLGLNYYMMKHNSKLQFAYQIFGDHTAGSGATSAASASGAYNVVQNSSGTVAILAFQVAI